MRWFTWIASALKKPLKKFFFLSIQVSDFIMNIREIIKTLIIKKPLKLDCGQTINDFPLAYETYGSLNKSKDNAILVFHALTGDQFVTGTNPITKKDFAERLNNQINLINKFNDFNNKISFYKIAENSNLIVYQKKIDS